MTFAKRMRGKASVTYLHFVPSTDSSVFQTRVFVIWDARNNLLGRLVRGPRNTWTFDPASEQLFTMEQLETITAFAANQTGCPCKSR